MRTFPKVLRPITIASTAGYALVVSVGFAAALWQKIEIAVGSLNEAVNAAADKNSYGRRRFLAAKL